MQAFVLVDRGGDVVVDAICTHDVDGAVALKHVAELVKANSQ